MTGVASVSRNQIHSSSDGGSNALSTVFQDVGSAKVAALRQVSSSTSAKSPPNPETLSRPQSHRPARVSMLKEQEMFIERSNSMVVVDDFQHDRQKAVVTLLVYALSGLSLLSALAAMYIEASVPAYVAFVFPLFVAPYAIHQRWKINKLPSLRNEIEKCRDQVARLAAENTKLHLTINNLATKAQKRAVVDDQLKNVAKSNNEDVTALRMLIYSSAILQRQMSKAMQARDLQHLLTTLLACDADKNKFLFTSELDHVLVRLEAFGTRLPRDVLRAALARAALQKGASTTGRFHASLKTDPSSCCGGIYVPFAD